ncbi:MAG: protoporphyrinogen oxidase [Puniceicoccales bacterium]|jgi:oxygen-dependent protoporphyrinogen oxidase|nr:protoporphyrinogen oxidase [Puniceicoccales bacterium]
MGTPDVIIIGAGPAGLSAAAALSRGGLEPLVLEKAARHGGSLLTLREAGYIAEGGPNSLMLEKDGVEDFFRSFGLVPQEASASAKKRFLVNRGRLVAAPSGPLSAITTPLLSLRGKLRILAEPFSRRAPEGVDESVADFVARRLGRETAVRLVDPMVSGIYAGDIHRLSLRSAFPRLKEMEELHGSLLKAGLRKGRAAPVRRIVNFPGGMRDITDTLAGFLGRERVATGARITSITQGPEGAWRVEWLDPQGAPQRAAAPRLILATPPWAWKEMPLPAPLSSLLSDWETLEAPPITVVSLGFNRADVGHALDGFGALAPGIEGRNLLGLLFQSSLFPDRAPEGRVLMTCFIGGTRAPHLARLDDAGLRALALAEVSTLVNARGGPEFFRATRWERAIPQYNIGHSARLAALDEAEHRFAGLHFTGNYRAGVALPKTIHHAMQTAATILSKAKG